MLLRAQTLWPATAWLAGHFPGDRMTLVEQQSATDVYIAGFVTAMLHICMSHFILQNKNILIMLF